MIIFNTTYQVSPESVDDFILWIKNHYVPRALECGKLTNPQLSLVLAGKRDEGSSYSLQFHAASIDSLEQWYRATGVKLLKDLEAEFGQQKVIGFSTLLETVDLL